MELRRKFLVRFLKAAEIAKLSLMRIFLGILHCEDSVEKRGSFAWEGWLCSQRREKLNLQQRLKGHEICVCRHKSTDVEWSVSARLCPKAKTPVTEEQTSAGSSDFRGIIFCSISNSHVAQSRNGAFTFSR